MVGPDSAPKLSFSLVGNQLTLFWPAEAVEFILESSETLTAPSWVVVNGGVNNQVTVDTFGGRRFFRLKM